MDSILNRRDILQTLEYNSLNKINLHKQNLNKEQTVMMDNTINHLIETLFNNISNLEPKKQREELLKYLIYDITNYKIYYAMGVSYSSDNMLSEARAFYSLAIKYNPDFIDSYLNLSLTYHHIDNEKAIYILEYAKKIKKDNRLLNTLAVYYADVYRYEDAEATFLEVINDKTSSDDVKRKSLINLAVIVSSIGDNYKSLKYFDECEPYIQKTNEIKDKASLLQNKLLIMNNLFINDIEDHYKYDGYKYIYEEHLKINNIYKNVLRYSTYTKSKKIRVGYVSSDFRNHVVSKFIYDIFKYYNTNDFDVVCYYNYKTEDIISAEIRKLKVEWHNIYGKDDLTVAKLIHSHSIDILIDLNGHTDGNRIGVFAHKPAKIQANYLGYPNTTGLKEIDYRFTDKITNPPDSKQLHSEKLVYINDCFIIYNNLNIRLETHTFAEMPLNYQNLNNNYIVFSAINRPSKSNKYMFDIWSKVLNNVPNSKFLVKSKSKLSIESMKMKYKQMLNISEDRLIILPFQESNDLYFDIFNKIDVLLDTFPYSGTTTTCDALYMGTPVITLYNKDCHAQNVSTSIIKNLKNDKISEEFIAYSENEYIEKCKNITKERVNIYKNILRPIFLRSMDPHKFIKNYETCLKNLIIN